MILRCFYNLYKLRKNQWLKTSELEEVQRRKLKGIIKHAYENVPYYRQLFDSVGVKPKNISTVEDLAGIPITTKSRLQELPINEIFAKDVNLEKCIMERTSGSTGMPLNIIFTQRERELLSTVWTRTFMENGFRSKDKRVIIRSISDFSPRKRWFQYLGLMRRDYISFFETKDPVEVLQKANPDIISSVPSILKLLAIEVKKRRNLKIQPKAIFSTSEILDQQTRSLISSTFKAEVFDHYSSEEFGCVGWECSEHSGYHVNIDTVVVELVWNGKSVPLEKRGKIICTSLNSYAMPLIRYEIGDIGILSDKQCPCGRGLPLMKKLEGRSEDFIQLSNGKMIAPTTFSMIIRGLKGIKQYRIEQEEINKLIIYLVKGNDFEPSIPEQIRGRVKKSLQEDIHVKIDIVDSIPRDSSGKLRSVISKVKIDEDVL